jgi:hypothetical protein
MLHQRKLELTEVIELGAWIEPEKPSLPLVGHRSNQVGTHQPMSPGWTWLQRLLIR